LQQAQGTQLKASWARATRLPARTGGGARAESRPLAPRGSGGGGGTGCEADPKRRPAGPPPACAAKQTPESAAAAPAGASVVQNLRQEQLGPLGLRVGEKLVRRRFLHDVALVEEDDPVGDFPGEAHLVGD